MYSADLSARCTWNWGGLAVIQDAEGEPTCPNFPPGAGVNGKAIKSTRRGRHDVDRQIGPIVVLRMRDP
jgi:hypothetical protein